MEAQDVRTPQAARSLHRQQLFVISLTLVVATMWLLLTPGGLLGKADAIGYAVCHRIDLRSFQLGDRILPLCSRCTGMYLGALFTFIGYAATRGKAGAYPSRLYIAILVGFAAFWAFDGVNSLLSVLPGAWNLYPPQNWLRLLTGTLIGVPLTTMIYPVFIQALWPEWDRSPVIPNWRWFAGLLGVLGLMDLAIISGNPLFLYPLAILSSLGVLVLLTMAYSVLALALFRYPQRTVKRRQLWFPILGGALLALIQVGVIDLLRFVLTGSWGGFHL